LIQKLAPSGESAEPKEAIMGDLSGKVAIVTGASKGIGAAVARALAKAGAAVAVNYASSRADADRVADEIVKDGGKAVAIQADVARRADVQRLFAETRVKLGRPSILVNNAGVYGFAPLEAVTEEDFHRQFNTNVLGAIFAAQEAVKAFDGSGGSVINISTIASTNPSPNTLVYAASKSAIDTITRELALELAGKGIRVNAIAPGMTETEGFAAAGLSAESAKTLGFSLPMGRIGKPEDIAKVAVFLASDQSGWVTGERISVSGGQR
jgi:3-oxoacyl-[acyl-carrier protein] reductase